MTMKNYLLTFANLASKNFLLTSIVTTILLILVAVILLFLLITLLIVHSAKYGALGKSALFENRTALPKDYSDQDSSEYSHLIGRVGVTVSDCKPSGKIRIDDMIYDVKTKAEYVKKDVEVLVTEIEGNIIYVEKIFKGEKTKWWICCWLLKLGKSFFLLVLEYF